MNRLRGRGIRTVAPTGASQAARHPRPVPAPDRERGTPREPAAPGARPRSPHERIRAAAPRDRAVPRLLERCARGRLTAAGAGARAARDDFSVARPLLLITAAPRLGSPPQRRRGVRASVTTRRAGAGARGGPRRDSPARTKSRPTRSLWCARRFRRVRPPELAAGSSRRASIRAVLAVARATAPYRLPARRRTGSRSTQGARGACGSAAGERVPVAHVRPFFAGCANR